MKKLILISAVMFASTVVNAASFTWNASKIYGPDGTVDSLDFSTATAYLWCDSLSGDYIQSSGLVNANGGKLSFTDSFSVANATDSTDYSFYMTIVTTWEGQEYTFTSSAMTVTTLEPDTTGSAAVNFGKLNSSDATSFGNTKIAYGTEGSAWAATPEPTSGLLLLCGLAGLALRRKRA